jgi:hypothetical protein
MKINNLKTDPLMEYKKNIKCLKIPYLEKLHRFEIVCGAVFLDWALWWLAIQ